MIKPIVKTTIPGPKSLRLIERIKQSVAKTSYLFLYGIVLKEGKGSIMQKKSKA